MGKNNLAKLSLEELAQELDRNPQIISRLVERGDLPVKVKGGMFSISREDLSALRVKFDSDRQEMLDAFKNKDTVRSRVISNLSQELDYDYSPNTDRILL